MKQPSSKSPSRPLIKQATFIKSAVWPSAYPPHEGFPEIAVAGRSNVGKSSLINALTQRKQLARVSNTPGRTQLLNFFRIDDRFTLCDLPGFGYAKVPLEMKRQWGRMMELYLTTRAPLRALLLLVDIRRNPGDWERELVTLGSACGWGVIPVVTKVDKLSRNQRRPAVKKIATALGFHSSQMIVTSSQSKEGLADVMRALEGFIDTPYLDLELEDEQEQASSNDD